MDYIKYIWQIKSKELAIAVKIADLKHNIDLSRLKIVGKKDIRRVEKYRKTLVMLEGRNDSVYKKIS